MSQRYTELHRMKANLSVRAISRMATDSYARAIKDLNALQSNAATIAQWETSAAQLALKKIPEGRLYVQRMGHQMSEINHLSYVHVAGTKGKGSTCAFIESVLRKFQVVDPETKTVRPLKTGLFTSPHLMEARERIRINGAPLSKDQFTTYFYDVWHALEQNQTIIQPGLEDIRMRPAYFQFLTLMAFHTFIQEKVDVVVLEVGIGGTHDATNIIEHPHVCCITPLGFDHMKLLGNTIESIASFKSGIFKKNALAFTVEQPDGAMPVVKEYAEKAEVAKLDVVRPNDLDELEHDLILGLKGDHQRTNAAMAYAVVKAWLSCQNVISDPKDAIILQGSPQRSNVYISNQNDLQSAIKLGLAEARWPGRSQLFTTDRLPRSQFFLDGAHTVESMLVCSDWIEKDTDFTTPTTNRVLVFNVTKGRSIPKILQVMADLHLKHPFDLVVFCSNQTYRRDAQMNASDLINYFDAHDETLAEQHEMKRVWMDLTQTSAFGSPQIHVVESIQEAADIVGALPDQNKVLVTGSLHLVGGMLTVLGAEVQ